MGVVSLPAVLGLHKPSANPPILPTTATPYWSELIAKLIKRSRATPRRDFDTCPALAVTLTLRPFHSRRCSVDPCVDRHSRTLNTASLLRPDRRGHQIIESRRGQAEGQSLD
ncbi:putative Polyketide synthase [Pseudozyma hubeiensis]|nr:putative Polyketide synthase [Pseudozyma hubeiensis]